MGSESLLHPLRESGRRRTPPHTAPPELRPRGEAPRAWSESLAAMHSTGPLRRIGPCWAVPIHHAPATLRVAYGRHLGIPGVGSAAGARLSEGEAESWSAASADLQVYQVRGRS